jgi:excisionase family DNA binding protein
MAAASPFLDTIRWMIEYRRESRLTGRPIPDSFENAIRHLLGLDQSATSANGSNPATPATVELSTAQMARRMGCSERWVRHLCQVRKLQARRSGHHWLITVEEEPEHDHQGRRP